MLQGIRACLKGQFSLIALGGNVTSNGITPEKRLALAMNRIVETVGDITDRSAIYRTPCFPVGAGPDYANAVIRVHSDLDPAGILACLHEIETAFGRERVQRWGERTLDLDLLAVGDAVLPDRATWDHWAGLPLDDQKVAAPDQLILPHPRIQDRAFVLVPLCDVAPDWTHPVLGKTAADLCAALPEETRAEVVPV